MGTPAVQFLFITISLCSNLAFLYCSRSNFYRVCMGDTPSLIGHMTLNNFRFQPPLQQFLMLASGECRKTALCEVFVDSLPLIV